jgi:hypothetical protein
VCLFIKTDKVIALEVASSTTIEGVKRMIQKKEDIHPSRQRLICAGKQLESNHSLAACKIQHESILHLVLRLPGSMEIFIQTYTGMLSFK